MENDSNQWHSLHNDLKKGLGQEIRLMRELLSNLSQEEVSLMLNDSASLNSLFEQRSVLIEKLSTLRLNRQSTTEKIQQMVPLRWEKRSNFGSNPPSCRRCNDGNSLLKRSASSSDRENEQSKSTQPPPVGTPGTYPIASSRHLCCHQAKKTHCCHLPDKKVIIAGKLIELPMRLASLIYGADLHHLDHLAPLSAMLGIPLLVTEESIAALAKKYYPHLKVECFDYLSIP